MTTIDPLTFEVTIERRKPFNIKYKRNTITSGAYTTLDVEALWEYVGPLKPEHYVPNLDRVMKVVAENKK